MSLPATHRSGIQVIARAASVLRALKDDPSGLSLAQIAERIGLPRSTVQRIVAALVQERLVIAAGSGGSLRLGPELHAMAGAAQFSVVESCRPYLVEVMQKTGETVDLSMLQGGRMVFLDQVEGTHRLRTVSSVGEVFPLTTTANGRAALALLDDSEVARLALAEGVAGASVAALQAALADVRRTGLAFDLQDHSEGISAIGFAFRVGGRIHALSVPVPSARFAEQLDRLTDVLQAVRAEVARALTP